MSIIALHNVIGMNSFDFMIILYFVVVFSTSKYPSAMSRLLLLKYFDPPISVFPCRQLILLRVLCRIRCNCKRTLPLQKA